MTRANPHQPSLDAERRAQVQSAASRVLSEAATLDAAVTALLPALGEALAWACAALWLVDEASQSLVCADAWSQAGEALTEFAATSRASRFAPGEGLPGRAWAARRAIWLSAVQRDPSLPRLAAASAAGLEGGLAFPVVIGDSVAGVVEGFTRHPEPITPELLQLTEAIGHQIGQFIRRREAERELEESRARYAAIVNGALDAIVAIDASGRVLEFNPAAETLFGYTRAEALGQDMGSLIVPPRLREGHAAGLARHRETGRSTLIGRRIEITGARRDGTEFPVELTITRMRVRGEWTFLGFMRDVTARQQHERERAALLEREQRAHAAAVTASALKDEFLAALSHELRTPLNAILGWSEMLVKGQLAPDRFVAVAHTIRRNADVQHRLVEDMLDLSAFIAGRVRLTLEPISLGEPIRAACEVVKPAAAAKRVRIEMQVPEVGIRGDRLRLQQVFWNLFTNALRFTPSGGSIQVSATAGDDGVTVRVRDTGAGIEAEFLPFVFDRFRQGAGDRHHGGLGLGLALVRQIVEAHGGSVSAESEGPGRGATFIVVLPRDAAG